MDYKKFFYSWSYSKTVYWQKHFIVFGIKWLNKDDMQKKKIISWVFDRLN